MDNDIEFYLTSMRILEILNTKKELSERINEIYPSDVPKILNDSYVELNKCVNRVLIEETKFLISLA